MAEVTRHADHDPALICRPAGYGLCELLTVPESMWVTVVDPQILGSYCGECGQPFRKGSQAQRIHGGYGYRCEAHRV